MFDRSTLKAIIDNKKKVTLELKFFLDRVEIIVEKVENAGYQHFLLFMPPHRKIEGISFYRCPSVCLHKHNMKT